jgi:hypothetical protein
MTNLASEAIDVETLAIWHYRALVTRVYAGIWRARQYADTYRFTSQAAVSNSI